jgi:Spy/CpxP family protein refolding chaperone
MTVATLLVLAGTALAQQPAPRPMGQDTPPGPGMMRPPFRPEMQDRERVMRFQQQIEERFGRMVRVELNLNDQQMDRLRTAMRGNQDRHQDLNRREQDLHRAMADQLQPGVAANQDSLGRMLDAALQTRVSHVQSDQQFNRDLAQFLTPVQRARLVIMMKRFEERVGEIRGRMQGPMPGQPGPMPMMRRPRPGAGPEEELELDQS